MTEDTVSIDQIIKVDDYGPTINYLGHLSLCIQDSSNVRWFKGGCTALCNIDVQDKCGSLWAILKSISSNLPNKAITKETIILNGSKGIDYNVDFQATIGDSILQVHKVCKGKIISSKYILSSTFMNPVIKPILLKALEAFVNKDFSVRYAAACARIRLVLCLFLFVVRNGVESTRFP